MNLLSFVARIIVGSSGQSFSGQIRREFLGKISAGLGVLSCFIALPLFAQTTSTATFAWNAVTGASGYRIYQGTASRTYTSVVDAGNSTQLQLSGLTIGNTYVFAFTAYNAAGVESDYSSELIYTVPASRPPPTPPVVTLSVLNGTQFQPNAPISLTADVIPNGHTISKVQFFAQAPANVILLGESMLPPYALIATNLGVGFYTISAHALYEAGGVADSMWNGSWASIMVAVPNKTITMNLGVDAALITAPFTINNGLVGQSISTSVLTGGRAAYTFTNSFPGNYAISAQVIAPGTSGNSFYVNVDAEPTDPMMIWNLPVSMTLTNQTVSWQGISDTVPKVFFLSAGPHTLIIRGREANAQLGTVTLSPAPFQLRALPNKQMVVSGVAQVNHTYRIQATEDFITWKIIAVVTTDSTGSFSFTDATAATLPARHYRLLG